jgi:hypothetical protein
MAISISYEAVPTEMWHMIDQAGVSHSLREAIQNPTRPAREAWIQAILGGHFAACAERTPQSECEICSQQYYSAKFRSEQPAMIYSTSVTLDFAQDLLRLLRSETEIRQERLALSLSLHGHRLVNRWMKSTPKRKNYLKAVLRCAPLRKWLNVCIWLNGKGTSERDMRVSNINFWQLHTCRLIPWLSIEQLTTDPFAFLSLLFTEQHAIEKRELERDCIGTSDGGARALCSLRRARKRKR